MLLSSILAEHKRGLQKLNAQGDQTRASSRPQRHDQLEPNRGIKWVRERTLFFVGRTYHENQTGAGSSFEFLQQCPGVLQVCRVKSLRSRVENWRGGLRDRGVAVAGGFRPVPVPQSVPLLRFQLPPHQTQHADFPHYAYLLISCQGLWDLSSWEHFQPQLLASTDPVVSVQTQSLV
jgi:hypothetical protein